MNDNPMQHWFDAAHYTEYYNGGRSWGKTNTFNNDVWSSWRYINKNPCSEISLLDDLPKPKPLEFDEKDWL